VSAPEDLAGGNRLLPFFACQSFRVRPFTASWPDESDVKADVMINRFVRVAVGRKLSDVDAAI
jgi:hypothetical protein